MLRYDCYLFGEHETTSKSFDADDDGSAIDIAMSIYKGMGVGVELWERQRLVWSRARPEGQRRD